MKYIDKIKSLSVDDMAKWLVETSNCFTCSFEECSGFSTQCYEGHKLWLESEIVNDDK
jgi:hypothetical protein